VTSRATCRGTRTRGVGEVVDDEPGVVDDERREEPRDEPRDVPRHPDARRREVVDDEPGVVDDERREEPRDEPRVDVKCALNASHTASRKKLASHAQRVSDVPVNFS
jgi:hypothetical protein